MIEVEGLCIQQGDFVLRDLDMQIPTGAYGVLMGRSGCGKTSVMEIICGLRRAAAGSVKLDGRDVTSLRPGERNVGYVPQDGALFPTMSVRDQVGFAMSVRRLPSARIRQRVDELAEMLGITHLLDRKPAGLSGGEGQRVAIGRALAMRPGILCMDEPLSSLDDDSRAEMIELLRRLRDELSTTCLHITHHQREAEELADVQFRLEGQQMIVVQSIAR